MKCFLLNVPIFYSLMLLSGSDLQGQNNAVKFDQIGLEQGLSQSSIYTIAQDTLGFIWFGTQDGLNRFDGYSVKVFKNIPGNSNSVADNTIMSLLNDKNGSLWIGTMNGGLDRYSPSEDKFYHYKFDANDSTTISENDITVIFEDSKGNIWIGTRTNGLNLYNPGPGNFTRIINNEKGNSIRSICEDSKGKLWIASDKGIAKIEIEKSNDKNDIVPAYSYFPQLPGIITTNYIKTFYIDKKGIFWIGTWGSGLFHYNIKTGIYYNYNVNSKISVSSNFIQEIYEDSKNNLLIATHNAGVLKYNRDKEEFENYYDNAVLSFFEDYSGNLWLGTFINGVLIYDERKNRFMHYYNDPENPDDLNDDFVYTILVDKDGEIWVRTFKDGINHFDKERKKVNNYRLDFKSEYNLNNNRVISLFESADGSIWAGTQKGELYKINKKTGKITLYEDLLVEEITVIYEDSRGTLWIANNKGKLYNFQRTEGVFKPYFLKNNFEITNRITLLYEDSKNNIWAGTLRNGLYCFVPGSGSFTHYGYSQVPNKSLNSPTVLSVYEDDSGIIWIGTFGGGLNKFNPRNNSFAYYTEENGLPNNVIYGILPDRTGNLWMSTNKGISRFNKKNEKFRNFDIKDGLQGNEFNNGAYCISSSGELFFGGTNGFNSFYPENIVRNNFIPPVHITNFKVFDEEIQLPTAFSSAKKIELSYSQNFFSFEFVALNYTLPEKNQYAYILEGFDKNWHYVSSSNRTASYTNIDPGKYILRVKGSNNDGIWNERGTSLILIITPPFWETWWFRTIIIALFITLIVVIYNYRVSQLLNLERLRIRIASDLHDEIGSSLGSIALRSRVLQKDTSLKENSRNELSRIHNTAMKTASAIRDIVWFINPDFDTLDDMILRMKDTAVILLNDIDYDFSAPDEIFSVKLSLEFRRNVFLCYKEILHNIAKHSNASKASIEIFIENKSFNLKISDNGKGFELKDINNGKSLCGNGLKNIQKRIIDLDGKINISSAAGQGTTVTISVKTT